MHNYYRYILFYRYPGETIVRAFAFNEPAMARNAEELGAINMGVYKANGWARSLCSQVNAHHAYISTSAFGTLIKDHKPGQLIPVNVMDTNAD